MSLAGKFVCYVAGDRLCGEIVEQVDEHTVLVMFYECEHVPPHVPPSLSLLPIDDMMAISDGGDIISDWRIFQTRADLDAWVKWIDTKADEVVETAIDAGATVN